MMRAIALALVGAALALTTGCSITSKAADFNGLATPTGPNTTHLNTTNYAVHLLFTKPIIGDATLENTVSDMTSAANELGAKQVRIVQSDSTTWWFILPPLSFIVHPVITNVAADATP